MGRASVMDYPAPLIRIDGDALDVSEAYGVGVGAWDRHAIRYAYAQFPADANEPRELDRIVGEGLERGLLFLSDDDARPAGAAAPLGNLWDNGDDPVAELEHVLRVRDIALSNFGEQNIAVGQPLYLLQKVLVPVYFHHRYQLAATAKMIGGVDYRHAVRGDGPAAMRPVSATRQRRALAAILEAVEPARLDLPDPLLAMLLPRPPGYGPDPELFRGATAPVFDGLGASASAADLVVRELLEPERCARVVDFHRRDPGLPGLEEVIGELVARTFDAQASEPDRQRAIRRVVQHAVVAGLIGLSSNPRASAAVRAASDGALDEIGERLEADVSRSAGEQQDHERYLSRSIRRHLARPLPAEPFFPVAPPVPPGSPIGVDLEERLGGCSFGNSFKLR
jgi:hypothetical protein